MTMNFRTLVPVLGFFCSSILVCASAQTSRPADSIVAVVNSEPVTQSEVRAAMQRVTKDMVKQRVAAPPAEELQRRVLERLINERAQLQHARETGIRVDESAVDQAEQNVARQNQIGFMTSLFSNLPGLQSKNCSLGAVSRSQTVSANDARIDT